MRFSWRGMAVVSPLLALLLLFADYRQQMRLVVLALRGEHGSALVVECRQFVPGLWRIRYGDDGEFFWSLKPERETVPVTYVWAICSHHFESFSVVGDARIRVWQLPLQIALFLGLSAY